MEKGYLAIVLHAHLPFVRHPEHDYFLEENWLYEAITETYIPLIDVFNGLIRDNVDFRVTMTLSPSLVAMLADPLLQYRYLRHINKLIELASKEVERTRWQNEFHELALMYYWKLTRAREVFGSHYHNNLLQAFKDIQDAGKLEIVTCAATHGFLPLMGVNANGMKGIRAQIKVAVQQHEKFFGRRPRGIWLPECGYMPGIDEILREAGIKFFFVESHGILHSTPRPKYGVFAPIYCPSGVAAFGRDLESSKQVWSAIEGYPGDYSYREFYRDVGFDLDYEYVKPYITPDGKRVQTGLKYYRITGPTMDKQAYIPAKALEKAAEHAGNFLFNREKQIEFLAGVMDRKPMIIAPYDAELFGHWWYEGPEWLNFFFRKAHYDQKTVKLIHPMEYLEAYPTNQVSTPSMSSWGYKGFSEVWLNGSNDWVYRHLHKANERMVELANKFQSSDGLISRALKQAARELLLAQSSDWAFIMKTGTMVDYAVKRTHEHVIRFNELYQQITENRVSESYLSEIESKDNLFPDLDYRVYS
jgi:1,4-alpha-glucan branching enzyme